MTDRSGQEPPERPTDNSIEAKFKIPVKYWYPTIIAVVTFTASGVWWFFSQIAPLETRITKLESAQRIHAAGDTVPFLKMKTLIGIPSDGALNKDQTRALNDVAFDLTSERRDLVVIVAGYVGQGSDADKEENVKSSEAVAQAIKQQLIARGLSANRIFARGYGTDVPEDFPSRKHLNVALMECDVLILMRKYTLV